MMLPQSTIYPCPECGGDGDYVCPCCGDEGTCSYCRGTGFDPEIVDVKKFEDQCYEKMKKAGGSWDLVAGRKRVKTGRAFKDGSKLRARDFLIKKASVQ